VLGHDQTKGRGWLCAWTWLVLVACAPAHAQEMPFSAAASEPVDLAAQSIRTWTTEIESWAILEGKSAVLRSGDGARADRAVVRVVRDSQPGSPGFRIDVYAEGHAQPTDQPGQTKKELRLTYRATQPPNLKPYEPKGLTQANGPLKSNLPLLLRAFPGSDAPGPDATRRPRPTVLPTSATAPAPAPAQSAKLAPQPIEPEVAPRKVSDAANSAQQPTAAQPIEPEPARQKVSTAATLAPQPTGGPPATAATLAPQPTASMPANGGTPSADLAVAPSDPSVTRAQFFDEGFTDSAAPIEAVETPPINVPPMTAEPQPGTNQGPGTDLVPLPDSEVLPGPVRGPASVVPAPVLPGSQRVIGIYRRDGAGNFQLEELPTTKEGVSIWVIRGGVNLVTQDAQRGTTDISADSVIIWRGPAPEGTKETVGPSGERIGDVRQPLEVYLEGNVVLRQDQRIVAGNGDQRTYRATRAYYDFRSERFVAQDAELDMFSPGLIAPIRMRGPIIQQFAPVVIGPDGKTAYGRTQIRSDNAIMTGSRFPNPGYYFYSKSIDLNQVPVPLANPNTGTPVARPGDPKPPKDFAWIIDARQNFFYMGPIPAFYWPHFVADPDDLDPPLRNIGPRFNNYFGQQLYSDWNGFKLFNIKKPRFVGVDNWNVDIDYLSRRKSAALGSEFGYFGGDLFSDIADEFSPNKNSLNFKRSDIFPGIHGEYFGYFDFWGLNDHASDVLGTGPAVVTFGPPGAGKAGFQRSDVPTFRTFRGRTIFRHMQSLLGPDPDRWEDFRLGIEFADVTDRYFLEQYYQRLYDTGLDQSTDAYLIRQKDNWAFTVLTQANLMNWDTQTQWAPKLDYYRLGDSLFGNWFTYYQDSGADWANTHTAIEVNNPNIFAFLPFDPVSNTSGALRTGRIWTSQELDMPLNFNVIRFVPYVQGQFVGWNEQLAGQMLGRVWGAAGIRANVMLWQAYQGVESELMNVHGLNHKINFDVDARDAFSNVRLNSIGVQDTLDDNTYEFVRRYFALTNYAGGLLPPQYDPRFLLLRRAISPITGTTDVQASMETIQLGIRQRLQTRRGPEGRRRVIDYMVLDLTSTYFPYASRDNFGKPFGQNMYNWEWYVGDRTSFYSSGWFEFFDIAGQALLKTNPKRHNDPFGITVVSSGISVARPPRGNITFGYSIINTGTISTSAMNIIYSYWFSPKWYGGFGTSYDFGNAVLLGSMFSLTRIGADYLTTVGLTVDPQRKSYNFGFEVSPRLSSNIRLGATSGLMRFDSRFAPTQ
jgi:hypothetical protein